MEVTVDDEGKTRVRHVYTVSAPIAGKVLRISHPPGAHDVSVHVGDEVTADETVVAVMQPTVPSFLDVRSREELQAAVAAADAAITLSEAEIRRTEVGLEFAREELKRAQALSRTGTIAARALEKAQVDVATNEAALASAKAQLGVRRSERASVAARLIDPSSVNPQAIRTAASTSRHRSRAACSRSPKTAKPPSLPAHPCSTSAIPLTSRWSPIFFPPTPSRSGQDTP